MSRSLTAQSYSTWKVRARVRVRALKCTFWIHAMSTQQSSGFPHLEIFARFCSVIFVCSVQDHDNDKKNSDDHSEALKRIVQITKNQLRCSYSWNT